MAGRGHQPCFVSVAARRPDHFGHVRNQETALQSRKGLEMDIFIGQGSEIKGKLEWFQIVEIPSIIKKILRRERV